MKPVFVYHRKPDRLRGMHLIPLNELRLEHPDVYAAAVEKYKGREHLTRASIPPLGCLWNDVVHLSPIHPSIIRKVLLQFEPTSLPTRTYLRIPVTTLSGLPAVYFERPPSADGDRYEFTRELFRPFVPEAHTELTSVPARTVDYYAAEYAKGKLPLLYNGVQHVLVQGRIPLKDAEEIVW